MFWNKHICKLFDGYVNRMLNDGVFSGSWIHYYPANYVNYMHQAITKNTTRRLHLDWMQEVINWFPKLTLNNMTAIEMEVSQSLFILYRHCKTSVLSLIMDNLKQSRRQSNHRKDWVCVEKSNRMPNINQAPRTLLANYSTQLDLDFSVWKHHHHNITRWQFNLLSTSLTNNQLTEENNDSTSSYSSFRFTYSVHHMESSNF